MNPSARPTSVRFRDDNFWVALSDGRVIGVPLARFPRLLRASREQREACRTSSRGLHWPRWLKTSRSRVCSPASATRPVPASPNSRGRWDYAATSILGGASFVAGRTTISTCCPNAVSARISRSNEMPRSL